MSKFVLALLHFLYDFRISRLFSAALLHFLQEIQYLLLAVACGSNVTEKPITFSAAVVIPLSSRQKKKLSSQRVSILNRRALFQFR
ncbi:hypothetical protein C162_29350, partial [Paenibacillus sp. FSL R7-269]|uniref:hypothetical protein n=1 Tax=Paenibacillus sp. FSL R7-269 TaxID=1226755 RepID=UPI0003E2B78B